jgi:hypothetical protein
MLNASSSHFDPICDIGTERKILLHRASRTARPHAHVVVWFLGNPRKEGPSCRSLSDGGN